MKRRPAALLFTDEQNRPIHDQHWSKMWQKWRTAAGWPDEGTFHSVRHYFATSLIAAGADPTDVQRALRHSSLRITLETYVHWWPKKQRRRNVVSTALRAADAQRQKIREKLHYGHEARSTIDRPRSPKLCQSHFQMALDNEIVVEPDELPR